MASTPPEAAAGAPQAASPATDRARRSRARLLISITVAVVVLAAGGTIAALALRKTGPAPPSRPRGLSAEDATFHSITLRWSRPHQRPKEFKIYQDGIPIAVVPGTATSYLDANLLPGTSYTFRMIAFKNGLRSPESRRLLASTAPAPPARDAILAGSFTIDYNHVKISAVHTKKFVSDNWTFTPRCHTGPCSVKLTGAFHGEAFTPATLHRHGADYTGSTSTTKYFRCNGVPQAVSLAIRVKVSQGSLQGEQWVASSFSGSITMTYPGGACLPAKITADFSTP